MTKLGFYFNQENCIGCTTCQIACKDRNHLDVGQLFRKVKTYEVGTFPNVGIYHFAGTCNHCADPACVAVCPAGALYIADDGTVQQDTEACIGCQSCVNACPYGHPQYIEDLGISRKCDSCKPLRDQGLNPACVDACCARVLEFGDVEELAAKHAGENLVYELPCLPSASETNPSTLINAKPAALEPEFREALV